MPLNIPGFHHLSGGCWHFRRDGLHLLHFQLVSEFHLSVMWLASNHLIDQLHLPTSSPLRLAHRLQLSSRHNRCSSFVDSCRHHWQVQVSSNAISLTRSESKHSYHVMSYSNPAVFVQVTSPVTSRSESKYCGARWTPEF